MSQLLLADPPMGRRQPALKAVSLSVLAALVLCGLVVAGLATARGGRDLVFLLAGATLGGVGLLRPGFAIWSTVVAFVFSGFVRRLFPAADPTQDFAAIAPFLVAAPLALHGITLKKPLNITLLLMWVTLSAGLASSPLVGVAGWLNFAVPLLVAFAIRSTPSGLRSLARATVVCGAIAGSYGVVQYFVPLSWDLAWQDRTDFISAGTFGQSDFRPFSTLPAPATAAMVCAAVILILLFARDVVALPFWIRAWALSSSTVLFLFTQVRAVWFALAAAVLTGLVVMERGRLRRLAAPLAVILIVLVATPQGRVIVARARTFTDLEEDVSYQQRLDLLSRTANYLSPFGRGLGTLSAGSRAEVDTSIDNGYLVVLGETGVVGLGLWAWVLASVARRAKRSDHGFLVMLLTSNLAGFLIGGFTGVLLWSFVPLAQRREVADPAALELGPRPTSPALSPVRV